MKPISFLLLLFYFAGNLTGSAQKQQIRFEHLETNQGLSQSNVMCILQDSRGFMWFGTRDGLNKYDGYKFTVYKNDPHNPSSISNNFIRAIIESKNGDLWIATQGGGVCRYDRTKDRFTNYKYDPKNNSSISNDFATSLREDSQGTIWIGTENGLNSFDSVKNQFVRYTSGKTGANSLGDSYIRCLYEDSRHNLWIGTFKGGLNLFNRQNKTFTYYQHNDRDPRSISSNNVYTIFQDSRQRLWIGTDGGGLELFDNTTGQFSHFRNNTSNSNSLAANTVFAINENNDHNLWIGTENGGLNIFNTETGLFQNYQNEEADKYSLNNNSVYAIYKDTKSNMWLGTFNGGVDMVSTDGNKFAHYRHILSRNSLSNNNVLCIYEDSRKNIWIGTDGGGLNLFDPLTGKFSYSKNEKNNKNSICGNYVLTICEDKKGNIWIGTWGNGVTVFNKERNIFRHFKHEPANPHSLSNNNAWKIFQDKDGNIWIGTLGGGLNMFDGDKSFTRFQSEANNKSSISSNNVQSILEDENGKLWITTDGGGLNMLDKRTKTFIHFLHSDAKNSVASNSTGSIYMDSEKNLWVGTMAGLSFMDKRTSQFTNYTTADGLPNNVIFGILEDSRHQLWVSTNKGISRFDRSKKTFKNFDMTDGLQSNEFKQQAYCISHTGKMYFGGNNGFNEFFPDSIKEKSFVPPLVITGFQIFNKEIAIARDEKDKSPLRSSITETKAITISHHSSVISFEFASLNYTIAEKKQYEYMLEGFDQKWNNIGTRRTATYTNLDPGKYVFKARGLNNDGTWSEAVTSLSLTIEPPFWLTWWFKTLATLGVVGCVVMIFRVRMKVITKQKERLQQKVKERTEQVERQKEKLSESVLELEEAQKQMGSQMKELALLKLSLEKEKYYLDSLMDNMPDAIYFKDKDSKLMRVSKYMANHFGMSVEELIGKSDFDFQSEIHAKEAFEDEQTIQRTKIPKIDYIEKEIGEDGSETWVTTTKMPLMNSKEEVVGTFGMSRDITKVKELEKERHAAELDKAVAQGKFEIASDVMHDIGNAVVGFGSYLTRIRRLQELDKPENMMSLTRFFEENKPAMATAIGDAKAGAVIKMLAGIAMTQRSNQEEIGKSITEQLNIITHIQEILNIQRQYISGHESQERKPVNLRAVVNDSFSMVFASIDKLAIGVSLNMPVDLPLIKGDRTKLMQAILNILKNSIEAIDKNADEKTISLNAYMRSNELVLQIKDSGTGFDKSTADQLFQRGFSTKTSGSGFGLYNCKSIIESHEGKIDITSEGPGKGTVTTIGFKLTA